MGLSVGAIRSVETIKSLIGSEVTRWKSRGVKIAVKETSVGNFSLLRCDTQKPWEGKNQIALRLMKETIAGGLTEIIIDDYEKLLVKRLVDENYAYLAQGDRDVVKAIIFSRLESGVQAVSKGLAVIDKSQRKSKIWAKLIEYLEKEDEIILEGFITFRLKNYLDDLYVLVEKTAEEHLLDREYREFLNLLRHFMDCQKVKSGVINIVRRKDDFSILDEDLKPVGGEVGQFLKCPPTGIELADDDLIVSAVVTLSPSKVLWHGAKGQSPGYDLLKNLLGDKLSLCPGCHLEDG